jgi:protein-tyrosine phosphatase
MKKNPIEIISGLWQGGEGSLAYSTVKSELSANFDAIATIHPDLRLVDLEIAQIRLELLDTVIERSQIPAILDTADWVFDRWQDGQQVLVRCQAGMNRSGLIIAITLMKDGYSAAEAISSIRKKNPYALSNSAFVNYLMKI